MDAPQVASRETSRQRMERIRAEARARSQTPEGQEEARLRHERAYEIYQARMEVERTSKALADVQARQRVMGITIRPSLLRAEHEPVLTNPDPDYEE